MTATATSSSPSPTAAGPVLRVDGVRVELGRSGLLARGGRATILRGVDLTVGAGEIVGLIGETGSGKTTLARAIVGLYPPVAGRVEIDGRRVDDLGRRARRAQRRSGRVQFVFQDPLRSLDPDFTVAELVGEGLTLAGVTEPERGERVVAALERVGLGPELLGRRPAEISGGQRQRVSIARAIVMEPALLICDEPVSALDASNRNHILQILAQLRDDTGLGLLVISHDLASLAGFVDRVAVLYHGQLVEDGPVGPVFSSPRHPYTALLIASAPHVARARWSGGLEAEQLRVPDDGSVPSTGCAYASRCPFADERCRSEEPVATEPAPGWHVACHHHEHWPRAVAPVPR